jgi:hypothetical protein
MPRVGKYNKGVTLWRCPQQSPDNSGFFEALMPSDWWIAIQPLAPSGDGRTVTSLVSMRYHPQVNYGHADPLRHARTVRPGMQNVDEQNAELRCVCEEIA